MLIRGATLPDERTRDVRIEGSQVAAVEPSLSAAAAEDTIDAEGLRLFPGAIDVHVHFREPGFGYKESWASGSASAVAGGVTTVVDQPNTDPPTIDGPTFDQKAACATASYADYGINGGVTPGWSPDSLIGRLLFALGEVFLADSTGELGIGVDRFRTAAQRAAVADVPVTVHAEDASAFDEAAQDRDDADAWSAYRTPAAEERAVETVASVAGDLDTSMHIAHASTPVAVDLAVKAGLTCEVTPHHLLLSRDDLPELGSFGRMNPPLRSENRREGMWERLRNGQIDMVATDHAPHTRAEKEGDIWTAASGVPGVETMLPLLLAAAARGDIAFDRVAAVTARRPAEVFDLPGKGRIAPGYDADLVLVDSSDPTPIRPEALHTACAWTPFAGADACFPVRTFVRGRCVYADGQFAAPRGRNVREVE